MSNGTMATAMVLAQAERVRDIVAGADYSQCALKDQREVQLFVVQGITALLHEQGVAADVAFAVKAALEARQQTPAQPAAGKLWTLLGGGGIGAGVLAGVELFGRAKGWW